MKALENRTIFSSNFDHGKKFKEHKDRLRSIRGVIDMKPPSSISTRCTSPSKLIIAKNAERERINKENLALARKIFGIMEGNGEITDIVNDTRHTDNHPGTMNFRRRLREAQQIHARNMLLAARLDTVKPYYHMADISVVKPIKKKKPVSRRAAAKRKGRLAKELELVLKGEQGAADEGEFDAGYSPRSDIGGYTSNFKFADAASASSAEHSHSARKAMASAENPVSGRSSRGRGGGSGGGGKASNVLLEYTKVQDGRVLDVAVLKEPFRDRYAIFGIDVDDGQRYELRLSSDEVSSILDGDILVTSVDNIEVWMALLNKIHLRKVGTFAKLPMTPAELDRATAESTGGYPGFKSNNNHGGVERLGYNLGGKPSQVAGVETGEGAAELQGMVPMAPLGQRPSGERPMSRNHSSGQGRPGGPSSAARPHSNRKNMSDGDDAMIMDDPLNPAGGYYGADPSSNGSREGSATGGDAGRGGGMEIPIIHSAIPEHGNLPLHSEDEDASSSHSPSSKSPRGGGEKFVAVKPKAPRGLKSGGRGGGMKQQQPYKTATPIPPATIKRDYALAPGRRASKLTAPAAAAAAPAGPAAGSGKHRPKPPAGSTAAAAAAGVTSSASGKQGKSLRNRAGSVGGGGGGGGSSKSGKKSKNAAASASVDVNVEDATGGAPPAAASAGPSIDSHSMIEDAQLIASVTTTDAMESAVANVGKAQQGDRKLDGDGAEHVEAAEKAGKLSRKGSGAQVHGAQEGQQETMHLGCRLEDEEESSVTVRPDEAARTDRRAGAGAADADVVADTVDTSGEDIYEEKEAVVVNGTTAKTTGGEQARAEEIIAAADATSAAQEIDEDQIEQLALKVLAMAKDNDHLAEAPNKDSGIVGRAESTEDGADYANDFESAGADDD